MARCRIGYLLALLGAVAFLISFNGYLSFYIFVLALVFPFFSLAVSLPGMLGARVSLSASVKTMRRGETATLSLTLKSRTKLPVGRLSARFRCGNLMTGDVLSFRKKGSGGSMGLTLEDGVESTHCGVIHCAAERIKVCDLLGIFSRRLPPPAPVDILALPLNLPPEEVPLLLGEGDQPVGLKPRPGGGPGDDYDLRPYRAGDPLRSVHWKLSSKVDGLVVRETLEPVKIQAVLTYDHFGAPYVLDGVFDRLDAVSRALIERERTHSIQWADPASGTVHCRNISSLTELRAFEHMAFSMPAPVEGHAITPHALRGDGSNQLLRHLRIEDAGKGGGEG